VAKVATLDARGGGRGGGDGGGGRGGGGEGGERVPMVGMVPASI